LPCSSNAFDESKHFEQPIRRSKATSNICTNQGLMVTAATLYLSLLGAQGLQSVARSCAQRTLELVRALTQVPGVTPAFTASRFHEAVLRFDRPLAPVLAMLARRGILGGLDLTNHYPELRNALLVCATETKTEADIEAYGAALRDIMRLAYDEPAAAGNEPAVAGSGLAVAGVRHG
jgi:glycine dehydrogenase subunit 1